MKEGDDGNGEKAPLCFELLTSHFFLLTGLEQFLVNGRIPLGA